MGNALKLRILGMFTPASLLATLALPSACGGDTGSDGGGGSTVGGAGGSGGVTGGGTGGIGGTSTDAGADTGKNCTTSSVGTCCTTRSCVDPAKAWELIQKSSGGSGGMAGSAGAAGAAGAPSASDAGAAPDAEQPVCPTQTLPQVGSCTWYGPFALENGSCCYDTTSGGCCGRPFVVAGEARLARIERSASWIEPPMVAAAGIDRPTLNALARAWLADARMEHASIASFSRFLLQLLGLGAPLELIQSTQQAIADEIAHARACFALASHYAGGPIGPGALDLAGSLTHQSLAEAASDAVHEGCVGETLAALQAEAQLAGARDPAVRAVLRTIADDEARHAELAWRFVHWAIQRGGEPVRAAVERAFEQAFERVDAFASNPVEDVDIDVYRAHGRLTGAEQSACHRAAVRDVIAPCAQELLRGPSARRSSTSATGS